MGFCFVFFCSFGAIRYFVVFFCALAKYWGKNRIYNSHGFRMFTMQSIQSVVTRCGAAPFVHDTLADRRTFKIDYISWKVVFHFRNSLLFAVHFLGCEKPIQFYWSIRIACKVQNVKKVWWMAVQGPYKVRALIDWQCAAIRHSMGEFSLFFSNSLQIDF